MITFEIPGMRLVNPTNEHAHWRVRHQRARHQRFIACTMTQVHLREDEHPPSVPLVITIVRIGPGRLDSDSLPPSGKHVRDGIADALDIDDGDETAATWCYRQERAKTWSVRVEIARRP